MKNVVRLAAIVVVIGGGIVACGNDTPACAGTGPRPPAPRPYKPAQPKPGGQRTKSKIQDKPHSSSKKTTTNPNWKSSTKPTTWGGYNTGRNWQQPYRKGMPTAPQPVIIHQYGSDYRTYPGYGGYYPVGVWPMGYGARYGCSADKEADPQSQSTPSPAPTVTVTVPATPSPTQTPR